MYATQIMFEQNISKAWNQSQWIIEEMFAGGMSFLEGYVPATNSDLLLPSLSHLCDHNSPLDLSYSLWSEGSTESDWKRTYELPEYVEFFHTQYIIMLHVDYSAFCSEYSFQIKLILDQEANLEIIVYRENLMPREETESRFRAICYYLKHLSELFQGTALFLGPDTLNYPEWPDLVPPEWIRLL